MRCGRNSEGRRECLLGSCWLHLTLRGVLPALEELAVATIRRLTEWRFLGDGLAVWRWLEGGLKDHGQRAPIVSCPVLMPCCCLLESETQARKGKASREQRYQHVVHLPLYVPPPSFAGLY